MKKKRKSGLDYIKAYNKKISKTKSPLTYIPIDIEAYMDLTSTEKGQVTKLVKKFDLRSERRVSGSNVSIHTRDLIKYLEKLANKRIDEFKNKYENVKLKSQGYELPEQAAEVYKSEAPLKTNINVSKLKPKDIKRKGESFQRHFKKRFYDESLEKMRKNYLDQLEFIFGMSGYDGNTQGLMKYLKDLTPDEFYKKYLENVELHLVFDISPNTRKKVEIEFPMPDGEVVYEAVAVGTGYAESVRKDLNDDLKELFDNTDINSKQLLYRLNNLDITGFFEEYNNDIFEIDYDNPQHTYENIEEGIRRAEKKKS